MCMGVQDMEQLKHDGHICCVDYMMRPKKSIGLREE